MFRTDRFMNIAIIAAIAFAASSTVAGAQSAGAQDATARHTRWEFLVSSGKLVPTGAQRAALETGDHTAAQLSRVITPSLAITSTLGWTRSRNAAAANTPHLNVFMVDVGSELRLPRPADAEGWTVNPFVAGGVGARSYQANSVTASARHNVTAYIGGGAELGGRRIRIRLEARDYVSGFRELAGGGARVARNDVVVMAGLRLVKQ